MRITLLRHAQTAGNLVSNYVGATDEPLAPEGRRTARRAAGNASVRRVHTSALARARETAAILYPKAAIVPHPGLNEMNFGRFEGKSPRLLEADPDYARWLASGCEAPCPGGEAKDDFTRRVRETFAGILRNSRRAGEDALHFVVHGGVLMAVMSGFVVSDRDYFSWGAGYCGGFVIADTEDDRFTLLETLSPPDPGDPA